MPKGLVLIVDNHQDAVDVLSIYFAEQGYRVITCNRAVQCVEMAERMEPDFIVLDLNMPEMGGEEIARTLRANPKFEKTIIIAHTGYVTVERALAARDAGFDYFAPKPVDMDELEMACKIRVRPPAMVVMDKYLRQHIADVENNHLSLT